MSEAEKLLHPCKSLTLKEASLDSSIYLFIKGSSAVKDHSQLPRKHFYKSLKG